MFEFKQPLNKKNLPLHHKEYQEQNYWKLVEPAMCLYAEIQSYLDQKGFARHNSSTRKQLTGPFVRCQIGGRSYIKDTADELRTFCRSTTADIQDTMEIQNKNQSFGILNGWDMVGESSD